ncbi:MAG: phenylacetate--CoA ligase [Planctomycetaceae bacterium]|jgi:phenylacetate-CoA ligase|nr:phenylacetate--CoA ligase [Planctomycetaceae bacterium]
MSHFSYENRIWDKIETLPQSELKLLQVERLRRTVERQMNVPFYKERYATARIAPDSIRSLDDLQRLPFTTKADLRENYPLGFLAAPREEVVRYHGSSGTTGKPTIVAYTKNDLDIWSNLCARFLVAGGLQPHHTVQIAFGYGLFTGGFGLHYGVEKVGAAIIPAASGNTKRQIMLIQDMQTDALVCTPSYALAIADAIHHEGIDASKLSLKFAFFGGETWTESMREAIENTLPIFASNNYGLSEVIGPGVSGECVARTGMHFQEDHFIVECLDPDSLEPVPEGEPGELVITAITKEATPLMRYRTRDIARVFGGTCPCGRTFKRMGRVIGRSDDMLIIRGVNVYPSQIEEALLQVEGASPHYELELTRPKTLDVITVRVEITPEQFSDKISDMTILKERISASITQVTGVHMHVEILPPRSLKRFEGKALRINDLRDLKIE